MGYQILRSLQAWFSKKRLGGRPSATPTKSRRRQALRLERLEDRTLLSFFLTGDPFWVSQGPEPIFNGNNVQGIPNAPQIGAVNQVAIDPGNADHMFAATVNGGVWGTGSGTADNPIWVAETDGMPSLSIGSVAISPLDSNTVFAGTARVSSGGLDGGPLVGIYRSTNNGISWTQLGQSTFRRQNISQIIPTSLGGTLDTQVVLVRASSGVYRSSDGGVTWGSGPVLAGKVTDVQADPGNSMRFYAAVAGVYDPSTGLLVISGQGIFRSDDGGQTWTAINNSNIDSSVISNSSLIELAVSSAGTNPVFAAVFDTSNSPTVYRSADQGGSWTAMDNAPPIGGSGFVADPNDANVVYIGGGPAQALPHCNGNGGRIFKGDASQAPGTEPGAQWTPLCCDGANGTSPHPDSRQLVFDPNGNLINANDGGIYRFYFNPPAGHPELQNKWVFASGNLRDTEFYSVAYDSVAHVIFGGTQDNGSPEQNGQGDPGFTDQTGGDGTWTAVDNSSNPGHSIHYTSAQGLGGFTRQTFDSSNSHTDAAIKLIVNGTGDQTLSQVEGALDAITPYVLDAVDPTRMLLGVHSTLYESTDQGDHLNSVGSIGIITPDGCNCAPGFAPLAYGGQEPVVIDGLPGELQQPDVIYAGGGGNLWLRAPGGSLSQLTTYTSVGGTTVKAIVLDPDDWHIAYVLDNSNHIWRTTDAGATTGNWTDITGNLGSLSSDLRSMEIVDGTPGSIPGDGVLLIGGLGGVFRRLDSAAGPFWSLFGDQVGGRIPDVLVTSLHYNRDDDILVAGTWGRGVWTVSNALLPIIIPETLQVSGDMDFVGENDNFRLIRDASDPSLLDVFVNNSSPFPDFSVKLAQISAIQVDGLGGDNTLIVDESNGPITLPYPVSAGCILSYDGGSGTNTLTVDASADSNPENITSEFERIDGLAPNTICYMNVSNLNIDGGSGGNTFTINDPDPAITTTINSGAGSDVVNVQAVSGALNINNGLSTSNDTVNIGSTAPSLGGTLANIAGPVSVSNASGYTTLNVDDSGDAAGQSVTVTDGSISGTWSPAAINYSNMNSGGISSLNLFGGGGGNTFNVQSTASGTTTSIDTDHAGSSSANTVNIGSNAPSLGGTLANIAGPVNVSNTSGHTALALDDSGDTTAQTVRLTSSSVSGSWSPAAITYNGAEVSSLSLGGGSGGNTFNIQSTAGSTATSINAGNGLHSSNTVTIGSLAPSLGGTLANIAGPVNVSNTSGTTALILDDSGNTTGQTVTVTNNSITGTWSAPVNYVGGEMSSLTVLGGSGSNTFNVQSTASGTPVSLNAGSGTDVVNVGNAADGVQDIQAALALEGAAITLTVDDSADTIGRNLTLDTFVPGAETLPFGRITGLAPAVISYEYRDTTSIALNTGVAGGNVVNVLATGVTTNLRGNAATTVNVGNAGRVQDINGTLNIENSPDLTTIVVDDSLHTTTSAATVTLSTLGINASDSQGNSDSWGQIVGLAPAQINYEYFDTASLTINGGGGTGVHTWNVQATGVNTTIDGGTGPDTFNVGSGGGSGTLDPIKGALTVAGGAGTDTLNANDQGTVGASYSLSPTILSRLAPTAASITYATIKILNLNAGGNDTLTVLSPVPTILTNFNAAGGTNTLVGANVANTWTIDGANHGNLGRVTFATVETLVGGTANDTFKFSGASASIAGTITGGGGTDRLDYSAYTGGPISVNLDTSAASLINGGLAGGFSGIAALVGSSASDTLTGPNSASIFNNWSVMGANAGKVVYGSPAKTFSFTGIENLVGGTGVDVFKFSAAGSEASVNGGGAPSHQGDWLDYSGVASAVTVDLNAGTAQIGAGAIVAIAGIQNVHGGNGGNTLTGNSQGNILLGGTGADTILGGSGLSLLIGDKGADSITGGSGASASGGDILIGGATIWDSDTNAHLTSLMAVLAEWQNPAHTYAQRVNFLRVGGGLNGSNELIWGTTVKDDGVANSLTAATAGLGTPAVDWFFMGLLDTAINTETGEARNNGSF